MRMRERRREIECQKRLFFFVTHRVLCWIPREQTNRGESCCRKCEKILGGVSSRAPNGLKLELTQWSDSVKFVLSQSSSRWAQSNSGFGLVWRFWSRVYVAQEMSSNWFDLDDDLTSDFFDKSKLEYIKKNFNLSSKNIESKNWGHASEVNDILDLATSKIDTREKSKLLKSLLKDRFMGRNTIGRASRLAEDPVRMGKMDAEDFFSDVDARVSRIRNRFANETVEADSLKKRTERTEKKDSRMESKMNFERSPSCSSANSYGFADVTNEASSRCRKDSVDSSWSRKSCQGNVTFPASSASTISEGYSEKTIGRSISRDSDDSVCTEKSINCSTVSEKLPDGTDKTQTENNESWLRKSNSGSKVAEKKLNDLTLTEKNDDGVCEKSSTRMSYLEKSATGSSLQEEMTSERMTSSSTKGGTKTVEQKTSSETYKSSLRSGHNKSSYYDDLDSCSFDHFVPSSYSKLRSEEDKAGGLRRKEFFRPNRTTSVSEKISKLIDEAVQQDDLFKIPSALQTDIDKMAGDFFSSKSFGQDKLRQGRKRSTGLFSGVGNEESYITCSKLSELRTENESLQQENLKLQSIIQDVTAVNKRWQKYNNERRLYVQKLLSTIQDLQEQINLISEKSAFQSKPQEDVGARHDEIERLKKEHQEHITVLELQIKSHKDDWDAERKEKRKALQEKEELEIKVQELTREVKFLKNVLQEERQRKSKICSLCKGRYEEGSLFQKVDFGPPGASIKVSNAPGATYCSAVHVPYETNGISNEECYCTKEDILSGGVLPQEHSPYFPGTRSELSDAYSNDRFSRTSKSIKTLSGDTIVVEDESGIRLSITEQFPSKDSNLKSILKKNDKKNKTSTKTFSGQTDPKEDKDGKPSRRPSGDKPNITCEEFSSPDSANYGLSIGFQDGGLAQVTSFSPDSIMASSKHYLSADATQLLKVSSQDSRSKSEPNTRSNSSENLKPLRESSSWNNESFGVDASNATRENVVCPSCDRVFPPAMHLQFLDHFEICSPENNHF